MKTTPAPEANSHEQENTVFITSGNENCISKESSTDQTPFELLEAIQNRAIIHAAEPPQPARKFSSWKGVRFTLGTEDYVVNMNNVAEVIPEPDTTPLPGTKEWIKGIANLDGRLVAIIDLNLFLEVPAHCSQTRHTLVISNSDCKVGLLVDKVHGWVEFPTRDFAKEVPDKTAATIRAFIRGCYQKEQTFPVFCANRFLDSQRFLAAAEV